MSRKRTTGFVSVIILSLLLIASQGFNIYLLLYSAKLRDDRETAMEALQEIEAAGFVYESDAAAMVAEAEERAASEAESRTREQLLAGIQARLESGEGAASVFRRLYEDKLVVLDAGRYFFLPVSEDIPGNPFLETDWEMDANGRMQYVGTNASVQTRQGIDVSKYQEKIDWKKVAADGIEFAVIRVGSRGSSEGKLMEDETFEDNIKGALSAGLEVGVYFYSQAVDAEEAREEAAFVLDRIEPYDITGPVAIDIESADSAGARTADLSKEGYTETARTFCSVVEGAGYRPCIYGNLKSYALLLEPEELVDYTVWYAYYSQPLYFPYAFTYWQYTATGRVDGIDGDVDLNLEVTFR